MPKCKNVQMSKYQNTKMPKYQNDKVPKWQSAKMPKCQNATLLCLTGKWQHTTQAGEVHWKPWALFHSVHGTCCRTRIRFMLTEAIGVHQRRRKNTVWYKTPLAHLVPSAWLEGEPVWVYVCVTLVRCKRAWVLISRAWSRYRTRSFSDYSGNDFVLLLLLM